ncbi:MAG: DinB family protein [Anaerolineales bacterium]
MSYQLEPTIIELFQYNHWANQELMTICIGLDDEIITASIPGAYGSIRDTFAHVLKAEISFLKRIHGIYPEPDFKWEENPSLSQMMAYETALHETLLDTLQRVPATQNVHEESDGWTFDYQARLIFMSVVYHGIAHRTDITTMLNNKGINLPELDVWGYESVYPEQFQARMVKIGQ